MQITLSDEQVKRVVKAANWYYGKDTPENQITDILADFCERTEQDREKEERKFNETIAATKKIIAAAKNADKTKEIPKCVIYLTDGTDRVVYGLLDLGELGYMAYSDSAHKKPAPIVPGLMHTWEDK